MNMRQIWLAVLIVFFSIAGIGQEQPNLDNGFKAYGTYAGGALDSVNLQNGNWIMHIPMPFSYPQRGGLELENMLTISSKSWALAPDPHNLTTVQYYWTPGFGFDVNIANIGTGVGLATTLDLALHRLTETDVTQSGTTVQAGSYYLTTWDGAVHQLAAATTAAGATQSMVVIDNSGYRVDLSNPDANGVPMGGVIIDRVGNRYHIGQWKSNCGRFHPPSPTDLVLTGRTGQGIYEIETLVIQEEDPNGNVIFIDGVTLGSHSAVGQLQDQLFGAPEPGPVENVQDCVQASAVDTITDAQGNVINTGFNASPADTLGRNPLGLSLVTANADLTGCPAGATSANVYSYPSVGGGIMQVKMCGAPITIQSNFGISGDEEYQTVSAKGTSVSTPTTALLIVAMILSDAPPTAAAWSGTRWTFNYDSYLNVTDVGLPTGGSLHLDWTTVNQPNCGGSIPASRAVAARVVSDNRGNQSRWTYTWGQASGGALTNIETDPLNNDIEHVFGAQDIGKNGPGCMFYETRTRRYQGTGGSRVLLDQVDTAYQAAAFYLAQDTGGNGGYSGFLPVSITKTVYPGGKVSQITRSYDSGPGNGQPIIGKVVTEKVYDWGQGAPGALLKETDTTYQWQKDSRYLAANLLDLPASVIVKDGNGNRLAETDYVYDEAAYVTASGVTMQHGATPNGAVRGSLTTVNRWLNTNNTWITTHTNWYDTGEPYQQIDALGNATTHSYDAAYFGAYSTQTRNALGQTVSGTYDLTSGLLTSFTNANATTQASGNTPGDTAHTTNYVYDLMFRPASVTAPPDPGNNNANAVTTFIYSPPNLFPLNVEHHKTVTNSLTDVTTSRLDGLGRSYRTEHITPGGTAIVDTTFDGLGRAASVSNPYFSSSDLTYGTVQTQYDGLGRVTQTIKQDGGIGTVSYTNNCTTATDEAGKQRRSCTDALGRLIEVDEPNPGASATYASGSVTIQGNEQSGGQTGVAASGTVTIGGSEATTTTTIDPCADSGGSCPKTVNVYDSGTVSITINGLTKSANYGNGSTAAALASVLANAFQFDSSSVVNASASGATISFVARVVGTTGNNYALSTTAVTSDPNDFSSPSFATAASGPALSGGLNPTSNPDSGTVTITLAGTSYTISYGGGDNSGSIAARIAAVVSAGTLANASASAGTVNLRSKVTGPGGDYALAASVSYNSASYAQPSFTISTSGASLTNGLDASALDNNPYVTLYSYDALGNLICAEQHGNVTGTGCSSAPSNDATSPWRVRRFTYDSLSRLLTATNPESGLITYFYDANGNLLQQVMPSANQIGTAQHTISYGYDALNRVTGKAYSWQNPVNGQLPAGTAVVTYTYDQGANGIGHLTSLTDQAGSASFTYDVLGRMTSVQRTTGGITKNMSYTYNLDGSIATVKYPGGDTISYTLDSAGRAVSAVDSANGINYVTGATYSAPGALTGSTYGQTSSFTGITNTFVYNNRLQPCRIMASTTGTTSANCLANWGNVLDLGYDFHLGNGDNGNVYGIMRYGDQTRNKTFTYDVLNRLASAQNAGTDCSVTLPDGHTKFWGNSYGYDAWGNLLTKSVTKCSAENLNQAADVHNRLQGFGYDAAGNLTTGAGSSNVYDAENRISGTAGFTYTYDADGNRVEKANTSVTPPTGTIYWYMTPGIVAESDLSGNLQSEYVFFDGARVARKDLPSNTVSYYFSDHLKTTDVITDARGNVKNESDFYPWGGEIGASNGDANHYKFTGKERDAETGLDYFGARYYSNGLGRFITPDWAAKATSVPYADFSDPQSLNLYTYVRNTPTSRADADGHCPDGPELLSCSFQRFQKFLRPVSDATIGVAKGTGSFALSTGQFFAEIAAGAVVPAPVAHHVVRSLTPKAVTKALKPSNSTQKVFSIGTEAGLSIGSLFVGGEGSLAALAETDRALWVGNLGKEAAIADGKEVLTLSSEAMGNPALANAEMDAFVAGMKQKTVPVYIELERILEGGGKGFFERELPQLLNQGIKPKPTFIPPPDVPPPSTNIPQ